MIFWLGMKESQMYSCGFKNKDISLGSIALGRVLFIASLKNYSIFLATK